MGQQVETAAEKLVIRRKIATPREAVYEAWTDAKAVSEWLVPGPSKSTVAALDVREGGTFSIVMQGETENYYHTGIYKIVDPPSKLQFTWISKGVDYTESLVTLEFNEAGTDTELVLTHEGIPTKSVEGHREGWGSAFEKLAALLER